MFGLMTRKKHMSFVDYVTAEFTLVHDRYWKLWRRHQDLLEHLGLQEVQEPERTRFVEINSPRKP